MSASDPIDTASIASRLRLARIAHSNRLAALAERSWRISAVRTPLDSLSIGASRLGGAPDVPSDFEWPTRNGRSLDFLAQLELARVGADDLPGTGWLLFFYDVETQPWGFDPKDSDGSKVVYVDGSAPLARRPPPTLREGIETCAITFVPTVDLPDPRDSLVRRAGVEIDYEKHERYVRVRDEIAAETSTSFDANGPYHHVLGHPQLIQNDMRGECALASSGIYVGDPSGYQSERAKAMLVHAPDQWRLLLQLDSDDAGPRFMWGDGGRIYFWIRRTDLEARAFDKTWLVLQCF